MRIGVAPTSIDFEHREPARGFEPTIRWIWEVESTDVSSAGAIFCSAVLANFVERLIDPKLVGRKVAQREQVEETSSGPVGNTESQDVVIAY